MSKKIVPELPEVLPEVEETCGGYLDDVMTIESKQQEGF